MVTKKKTKKVSQKSDKKTGKTLQFRTKRAQAVFIKSYIENCENISKACLEAGITRTTFYDWEANDSQFSEKLENAMKSFDDMIVEGLQTHAKNKNLDALKFLATKKKSMRDRGYSDKVETEVSGQLDTKTELIISLPEGFEEEEK